MTVPGLNLRPGRTIASQTRGETSRNSSTSTRAPVVFRPRNRAVEAWRGDRRHGQAHAERDQRGGHPQLDKGQNHRSAGVEIESQGLVYGDFDGGCGGAPAERQHNGKAGDAQHEDQAGDTRQAGATGEPLKRPAPR